MTPKEKAEELFEKFTLYLGTDKEGIEYYVNELEAKRSALIAVDEILSVIENPDDRYSAYGLQLVRNWREVKQEIEKL